MTVTARGLLRALATAELATLALLLLNLVTVHAPAVSGALGPLHGLAYVGVIALVVADEGADAGTRARALLPGIGGRLALRRLAASSPRTGAGDP